MMMNEETGEQTISQTKWVHITKNGQNMYRNILNLT